MRNPILASTLFVLISGFAGTIIADDPDSGVKPVWRSLGGDFRRTGLSENPGPESGCVKWKFETEGPVSSSVTIGLDNKVHIACEDGNLYTIDFDGRLIWNFDANSPLLSSPSIGHDGTVYVGSKDGKLLAIGADGDLLWTYETEGMVYSSPAVSVDGNVYVCSQDGTLSTLDKDGGELWIFETASPGKVPTGAILASPAIGADGTIYIGGLYDPNLYALNPIDGSLKWKCNFKSQGWHFASPVIAQDGTIYQTLLYDTNLYAIEPDNGSIIWSTDLADAQSGWFDADYADKYIDADGWSEPVLGPDGTIYVSFDDPYLRAVTPDGSIKWITRLGIMGGFTLAVGENGFIYAAGDDGHLCVVDTDGNEIARFESDAWLNFPVISADGTVIVADSRDGSMLIEHPKNAVWAITTCRSDQQRLDLRHPEDLNADGMVNFIDLALLAADWLGCTDPDDPCYYDGDKLYLPGDIDRNLYTDIADLEEMANQWLGEK